MSRGFVKEGDREEIPMVPPRAYLPQGAVNYVTPQGLDALVQERSALLEARETATGNEADVRVTRNYLNAKLLLLQERIRSAVRVPPQTQPPYTVALGAYVTFQLFAQRPVCIRITGADEADGIRNLSFFSPLAQALAGHNPAEEVDIPLPSGTQRVTVVEVTYTAPAEWTQPAGVSPALRPLAPVAADKTAPAESVAPAAPAVTKPVAVGEPEVGGSSASANKRGERTENLNEVFPIVNERGLTVGRAARWQCHDGSKILHPVVHLHLFNSRGDLYLQKRPVWKQIQPGKWDTSVGGHMAFGETPQAALGREALEELGIEGFTPVFVKRYVFESDREKELVHVFKTVYDGPVLPGVELDGGRFWTRSELTAAKGTKVFTPNFESEYFNIVDKPH